MKCEDLFIAGVGVHLPPAADCAEAVKEGWCDEETCIEDGWISAAVAPGDLPPCAMAVRAGRVAMSRAEIDSSAIDILFYAWSNEQGPHMWLPQFFVERNLIGRNIPAIGIRQACAGIWTSAELAACYLSAPGREAAVVASADNWGFDPMVGMDPSFRWKYSLGTRTSRASVFGDVGAAMVLSRRKGFARILALSCRSVSEMEAVYRGGGPIFPPEKNTGRPIRLGERVKSYSARHPEEAKDLYGVLDAARTTTAREVMKEAETEPEDIARVLHVHAGNSGYITRVLESLGVPPDRGVLEFGRRVGHLASADQVAALEHLVKNNELSPGDRVLVVANGAGASVSCAVIEMEEVPTWSGSEA